MRTQGMVNQGAPCGKWLASRFCFATRDFAVHLSNKFRFDVFLFSRGLLLRGKPGKVEIFMTQARSSAQWT